MNKAQLLQQRENLKAERFKNTQAAIKIDAELKAIEKALINKPEHLEPVE